MARRKPVEPSAEELGQTPPRELLRFVPSQPPPIGPHGRPQPWAVKWTAEDFASWLRARAAWRDTHTEPLPGLPGLERSALARMDLPAVLIEAEQQARTRRHTDAELRQPNQDGYDPRQILRED